MNVRNVRGRNENLDAFYTLKPLNFVLRMLGLNCIYRDGAVLKYDWSVAKTTILILLFGGLNVFSLYYKLYIWNGVISFTFKDAIQIVFIFGYFQYLLDLFYVHKYGRDQLLEYFRIYERIDSVLGKTYFREIRSSTIHLLISFTAISFISSVIDFSAWLMTFGMPVVVTFFIDYTYVMIRNFSIADVIAQVTQVLYRLKSIGDLLKEYHSLSEIAPGVKDIIDEKYSSRKVWKKTSHLVPFKTIDQYEFLITKLSGCYLLILEQCDHINAMYGVRTLAICLSNLIDIIILLNLAIRISLDSMRVYYHGIYPALSSLIRTLACALVLVYEVYRCQQTYNEINRIIRYVDYLLITKNISFEARDKLRNFRALVISRPVQFHAVNFYKLDCTLLLSVGSVVVTYTMILLQNMD
ncbi:uncharacterized protein [Epargyreus clarus]|uniref:uncharacterized protein n=1 Tax=Epargyreus clarus TaxID=520877 RepID=UPI003C2E19AB